MNKKTLNNKLGSGLFLARHLIVDFYDCDINILLDCKKLEKILILSAKKIWVTIISSNFNIFEPQWVSWVVILSESHFTIHTWPEYCYAAVDIFTCWNMNYQKWINFLTKFLKSKKIQIITDQQRWLATKFKNKKLNNKIVIKKKKSWKEEFKKNNNWWIACSIDVYDCNPKTIRNSNEIKRYVKELCNIIKMNRFWNTKIVHFGENAQIAWYSMTQLIETSLISAHFANKTNTSYIDIFSCKYYDPAIVANFTTKFFEWKYYKLKINMRNGK